jgi:GNAT superfamily N-acetyltransferase
MTVDLKLIKVADDPELLRKILALRVVAWKSFINVDPHLLEWTDQFDSAAQHWAILDGETVAAAGRLSIHERLHDVPDSEVYEPILTTPLRAPIASINRLVVHPAYRGRHLSDQLDEVRISAAEKAGCSCVIGHTHAGDKRVAQLVAEGFEALGTGRKNEQGILKGLIGVVIFCPLPRKVMKTSSPLIVTSSR